MDTSVIIETSHLTKAYDGHMVVKDLSFQIREGETFGFLGPNGAGKSTTLLMLLGLTQPTSGTASVLGLDPVRQARDVKRIVGFLPENVGFYGDLNAEESLRYVADLNGLDHHRIRARIFELLELVGLKKDAHKKLAAFSRGMKQRLGIAEVLIKEPKIIFFDEPTLGLDPDGAIKLIELIQSLNRERHITVLLSSHHLHHVQKISHRVGIMISGSLVAQGTIHDLAREKFGIGEKEYSLEEVYMKYFQEA
ncbi:MAG: ABC transporter ATP-binding protein [Deltaproteobacteria bacterium]|nr:MAG: ABC transporter ATP-binding protein [Deltaproteobacteria bacterium]